VLQIAYPGPGGFTAYYTYDALNRVVNVCAIITVASCASAANLTQSTVKNAQAAVRKRLFVAKKDW
jgi:hypothetical protein